MSKILFVYPFRENESMAIQYLSASLKQEGHETDLILLVNEEEDILKQRIKSFNPDFICFSVMTDDYAWSCRIAKLIKSIKNIPIIFGGIHVTSCPEEVIMNKFIDYIVLGEGEEAIKEIVENPKREDIKNVWIKKNGRITKNSIRDLLDNLDKLPFPDRMLYHKEASFLSDIYHCMTSRGCPFGCSYCFNSYMKAFYKGKGTWLRRRSVDNVIEELRLMKEKLNYKQILFIDDCFTNDEKWLREFIPKYKREINVPFKAIAHPLFINEEIVKLLKEGGCIRLQLGVQTPSEEVRRDICKRVDTNKIIKNAVEIIKKYKISVQIDHIFGLPGDDINNYKENVKFYIDLKPNYISSFWLQYYPNTDIINMGIESKEFTLKDLEKTVKGEYGYEKVANERMKNYKLLSYSRFFNWIPILPRWMSYYILNNELYDVLFRSNKLNKIPYLLHHLSSVRLIKTAILSIKRKKNISSYYNTYKT